MRIVLLSLLLFLLSCATKHYTPEQVVDLNIEAAKTGDAETRWELLSAAYREKLTKDKTQEEVLERFKKEVFMYKFIKSWNARTVKQDEKSAQVELKYKFLDPHSNKVLDQKSDIELVKENGFWKIND